MAGAFWDSEVTVVDVPKLGTKATFYRVKQVAKGGRKYIDLREHYTKADGTEQYTTKGSAIPVEGVQGVIDALTKAVALG